MDKEAISHLSHLMRKNSSLLFFKILGITLKSNRGQYLFHNQGSVYDRFIIPFEKKIEKYITSPFGLNLTAILRKK